jgi:hypothetical protein
VLFGPVFHPDFGTEGWGFESLRVHLFYRSKRGVTVLPRGPGQPVVLPVLRRRARALSTQQHVHWHFASRG